MTTPRRPESAPKKPSLLSRIKAGLKSVIGQGKKKAEPKDHAHHPATIHAHKRPHDDKPREHAPRQRDARPPREHDERRGPPRGRDERRGPRDRNDRSGGPRDRAPREDKPVRENHAPVPPPPAPPVPEGPFPEAFEVLGLSPAVLAAVRESGYATPTTIQEKSIPIILTGKDVVGASQTGTGKTAAFALPTLTRMGAPGKLRVLVLEPVRELAAQVVEQFEKYGKHTGLRVLLVHGGVGYEKQRKGLQEGVDVVVATPGRLLDFMQEGIADLRGIEVLILDEVDRMLDMGFLPDVRRIVQKCPKARQTLFFTATLPPELEQLAGWALNNPVKVEIGRQRSPAETVSHAFYPVVAAQKFDLLQLLLEQTEFKSVLIFSRTRMGADRIAHRLQGSGHSVGVLHSDRSQRERIEALDGFKSGKFEVLVATDIAARGLDIAGVSHVINYDVPENAEDYVHRIGRTGRAQATGDAFTLVTEEDVRDARSIERYMGLAVERKKIEGFPYIYSALFDEKALADTAAAAAKPTSRLHRGVRRG